MFFLGLSASSYERRCTQPPRTLSVDTHMYQLKAHVVNSLLFSLLGRWTLLGRPTGSRRSITGLFTEMDQRTVVLWGLITHSLRASKSSSPQGQRQCTKTWQPVEIIYSVRVHGVDLKSITFPSLFHFLPWLDYVLLALNNCPITLDQWNTLKLSKSSLQHVSQMAYLAQTLQSNVNNKKEFKIRDDDCWLLFILPHYCPLLVHISVHARHVCLHLSKFVASLPLEWCSSCSPRSFWPQPAPSFSATLGWARLQAVELPSVWSLAATNVTASAVLQGGHPLR